MCIQISVAPPIFSLLLYYQSCRITDPYESLVLSVLGQLLVDGPASPFYQALLDSKIGSDYSPMTGLVMVILCGYECQHNYCFFMY